MRKKLRLQTLIFITISTLITLSLVKLLVFEKEARQLRAIEKEQKITIPFKELKEKYKNE
jgi:membrane protein insertase Oxa1/YidC/SpoIIIJ